MGGAHINPLIQIEYAILGGLLLTVIAGVVSWRTAARCRRVRRILLTSLRVLAVAGLVGLALNPGRWRRETIGVESEWAVLIDRSRSMATADVGGAPRWKEAMRLADQAVRAARKPDRVRLVAFADRDEPVAPAELAALKADGGSTDMIGAGHRLLQRGRSSGRRLAGILLLSDGRQTVAADAGPLAAECRAQQAPVFAVPLGGDVPRRDLSVSVGRRQHVAFKGQKVRIAATLRNDGMGPLAVTVAVQAADGRKVAEQEVKIGDAQSVPVAFVLTPTEAGYSDYDIVTPERGGEASALNNRVRIGMSVLRDKLRLFMLEGNPSWESKFLVQLLRQQANMEVTTVYRLSADRFVRVDTDLVEGRESSTAIFPDSAEALAEYDAVLVGKGAEYFLTPERIALLRRFVSGQGACLIFTRGKPYSGTLPELESLEPVAWGPAVNAAVRFAPARSAGPSGLFGAMLPGAGDPVWERLPPLQVASRFSDEKPFTRILAEGAVEPGGSRGTLPLLAARRVGRGLVLTMNAEDFWRWDFFPSIPEAPEVYREFWPQLLLWATVYSEFLPGQDYALRLSESAVEQGGAVVAHVTARRTGGKPPLLRVGSGGTVLRTLTTAPAGGDDPHWVAQISGDPPGLYRVEVMPADAEAPSGAAALLEVKPPPAETDNLSVDRVFLETLARESGGAVVTGRELAGVVERLDAPEETRTTGRTIWEPVWNRAWVLVSILALLAGEWFLRRRAGLM